MFGKIIVPTADNPALEVGEKKNIRQNGVQQTTCSTLNGSGGASQSIDSKKKKPTYASLPRAGTGMSIPML